MLCLFIFSEKDGDIVSITLPASQHSWTIAVTKSPQTSTNCHIMKDRLGTHSRNIPSTPAPGVGADPTGPVVDTGSIDFAMETLSLGGRVGARESLSRADPPSHLRACLPHDQFCVSNAVIPSHFHWLEASLLGCRHPRPGCWSIP
jgi:hypothetical protein